MKRLKFYKTGNGFWFCIWTLDQKFLIERDAFTLNKVKPWFIYRRCDNKTRIYEAFGAPSFNHYIDAMNWICENNYPEHKIQKKLVNRPKEDI